MQAASMEKLTTTSRTTTSTASTTTSELTKSSIGVAGGSKSNYKDSSGSGDSSKNAGTLVNAETKEEKELKSLLEVYARACVVAFSHFV